MSSSTRADTTRRRAASGSTSTATGSTSAAARSLPAESHCEGTKLAFSSTSTLHPVTDDPDDAESPELKVKALQCLLTEQGTYAGQITGVFNAADAHGGAGLAVRPRVRGSGHLVQAALDVVLVAGHAACSRSARPGPAVRRLQRALNAADKTAQLRASGVYRVATEDVVRAWQERAGLDVTGVVAPDSWAALARGEGVR